MVLNTLHGSSSADLSLEDMFISLGQLEQKRAQAQEWQRLPKGEGERDAFEHSTEWAGTMFARLMRRSRHGPRVPPNPTRRSSRRRVSTSCRVV